MMKTLKLKPLKLRLPVEAEQYQFRRSTAIALIWVSTEGQARSGDRIVIDIKKLQFESETQESSLAVFTIAVN